MLYIKNEKNKGSLPEALLRRYRSCDGPALKVALWLLSEGSGEAGEIADSLALPLETVERAAALWLGEGLISEAESAGEAAALETKTPVAAPRRERGELSEARAGEMLRNPEVAVLLQESQSIIGRTLRPLESRILLEIFELDELPVEVILTILAYCVPRNKKNRSLMNAVARAAGEWSGAGVRDARSAAEYVKLLETREKREREVAGALGYEEGEPFGRSQRAAIASWYEELGYDASFAKEAFERSGRDSIAYINGILKNWHKKGYRTLKDTYAEGYNHAAAALPHEVSEAQGSLFEAAVQAINNKDQ